MSTRNSEIRCVYCLASNTVPPGNAKCCCTSCGRIFELPKSSGGMEWATSNKNLNPPIVVPQIRVNYQATSPKITGWPWPALASRSEEGRHKFFSNAFRHLILISLPCFACILVLAIAYETSIFSLLIIIPLAFVSALAMGIGQTWIVDNAYREGKSTGLIWWTPLYLHFYILTRWAICWRPMGLIAMGGAFFVALLIFILADQLGTSVQNNRGSTRASSEIPQQARSFDSKSRSSPAGRSTSRSSSTASSWNNAPPQPTASTPATNTVWSYESLAVPSASTPSKNVVSPTDAKKFELPSQPVISPVFDEDDGFREWSNVTGTYKVLAQLEAVEGEFAQLKTRDGRKIRVEIAKLCKEDRSFLEPILKSSPFEIVGER